MNSRMRSACYPRGNFYPLSDDPSTRYHRITKPHFRACSTRRSHSQAPLCLCTQRAISNRAEGTFGHLRYLLGGYRPSKTARQALSLVQINGARLGSQYNKGSITLATPSALASGLHSLLPILYKLYQNPVPSYSKAPRGLFV